MTLHHRRSIRLPGYDYTQSGAYFITIVTKDREPIFGAVEGDQVRLNKTGQIARDCWREIPGHFPNTKLGEFVIMPDHVHGIINIFEDDPDSFGISSTGTASESSTGTAGILNTGTARTGTAGILDTGTARTGTAITASTRHAVPQRPQRKNSESQFPDPFQPSFALSNPPPRNGSTKSAEHRGSPSGSAIITSISSAPTANTNGSRHTSPQTR